MTRTITFILFPGFQLLDAAGPMAAFEVAGRFAAGAYELELTAPGGGTVMSSSGVSLTAQPLRRRAPDTVVVAGGDVGQSMSALRAIVTWLHRVRARRIASVCSGAYLLAEAGLLDGRRATTHWNSSQHFTHRYPKVQLAADRIFIRDGHVWKSAGISAGIDLALALIEDDLGHELARRVAQQLVVHQRRPGGQSQFSALVDLGGRSGRFSDLVDWMGDHLSEALTVERLAERAAMSPRHFARAFVSETGTTPAKAVERLRVETARCSLETTHAPLQRVAEASGFGDPGRMRRAFLRVLGQPPQAVRRTSR